MSSVRPARKDASKSVVYVYGVARVAPDRKLAPLPRQGIIGNAPVRRLVHGNLVAFGSTVPASRFAAAELRSALADTKWLRARILAHEKVLERLRSRYDIVPFRFCTIYRDAAQVSKALARHRTELNEALDRVRDASEWGLKLYCDSETVRRHLAGESSLVRRLHQELAGASPGTRYFLRKQYDRVLDVEVAAAIARCVEQSDRSLAACAREGTEIPAQPRDVHGRLQEMVANRAYLLDAGAMSQFQRAVAALQARFAAHGFSFELSGPWPPYHFVSPRQEGIQGAARSIRQG
ncbi:MAG: GvpL/GvpF family gas vesicle protein [Hyphomicrobiaceae bacterium]|nr:MAG: GvpL/GvpF family gas vesicle protein [Hyphomicrobiaceae bacterium]